MSVWHPDARRVVYSDIGQFLDVPRRIVWHTTEGYGLPVYANSHPHFTLNPKTGDLWQHSPIDRGVKTLKNLSGGVETNRAGAIQVELIGFARDTPSWPDSYYDEIADLARWIERNGNVSRTCQVEFSTSRSTMTNAQWMAYRGHCGHQHVPEQNHWDPGAFKIGKVLELNDGPFRRLNDSERGPDVSAVQRAINRLAGRCCRPDRRVTVDGIFGPRTLANGAWALFVWGVQDSKDAIERGGLGVWEQQALRDPAGVLSEAQKARGRERRRAHCKCDD
jgi:hypothetical protein